MSHIYIWWKMGTGNMRLICHLAVLQAHIVGTTLCSAIISWLSTHLFLIMWQAKVWKLQFKRNVVELSLGAFVKKKKKKRVRQTCSVFCPSGESPWSPMKTRFIWPWCMGGATWLDLDVTLTAAQWKWTFRWKFYRSKRIKKNPVNVLTLACSYFCLVTLIM